MKNVRYLFIVFLFANVSLFGQISSENASTSKQVVKYLKDYCTLIKKNALYADSLNWNELESKLTTLSKGMTTVTECRSVIDTIMQMLKRAGDRHSFFLPKEAAQKEKSETYDGKQAESYYLSAGIGYIKVPEFTSFNATACASFASNIQNQIKSLDESHAINGWIVDLRDNTGGNMYPMILGLSALTQDGIYGYIIDPKHKKEIAMSVINGGTGPVKIEKTYKIKNSSCKIAILINPFTGSSGEFTAISFLSLPNVETFGQPSAGATTSNYRYDLSDGSYLLLATAYMADRNHKKYLPNIIPDILTPNSTDSNMDPALDLAQKWLLAK
jgi:carboxyl-terminal processing protease